MSALNRLLAHFGFVVVRQARWKAKCDRACHADNLESSVLPRLKREHEALVKHVKSIRDAMECGPHESPRAKAERMKLAIKVLQEKCDAQHMAIVAPEKHKLTGANKP